MDLTSSQNAGNYTISGLTVQSATRLNEPNRVRLVTSFHKIQTYQVVVRNVRDLNNNLIPTDSIRNVANFTGEPPEFLPPQVLSAIAPTNTTVEVRFRDVMDLQGNVIPEELDRTSAIQVANYVITPTLTVSSIAFSPDRVILTTSPQIPLQEYAIRVVNVADKYLNPIIDDGTNIVRFIGKCTDITPPALATISSLCADLRDPVKRLISPPPPVCDSMGAVSVLYNNEPEPTWQVAIAFHDERGLSPTTVRSVNNYRITDANGNVLSHTLSEEGMQLPSPRLLSDGKTIVLTTARQTQGVNYTLTISNIADECQNVIASPIFTTFRGADSVPPKITGVNVIDHQTLEIIFSEALNRSSASNIYNYTISFANRPGELGVDLTRTVNVSGNIVRLPTREQQKEWYILEVHNVTDEAGNRISMELDTARQIEANKWRFEGKSKDTTAPYVKNVLYQKHPNRTDLGQVVVKFSEAMHSDTALTSNYEISPARIIYLTSGNMSPDRINITLDVEKFTDGVSYTVKVKKTDKVKDVAGNVIGNEYISRPIVVDNTPPQLLSARAIINTQVELTFSEDIGQPGSYTITPTLTITSTKVEGNKVLLTTSSQTGGVNYTVVASGTTDKFGNIIGDQNRAIFGGRHQLSYPYLQNVYSISSTTVRVDFDRALDQQSAETSTNYEIRDGVGVLLRITKAEIIPDGKKLSVRLTTATQRRDEYRLIVKGVKLEGQNIASPEQQRFFTGIGEIIPITEKPRVTSVIAISQTEIIVKYDRKMSASISVADNYSISGGLLISGNPVGQNENKEVKITTTTAQRGVDYTLTLSSNIKDEAGNSIDTASQNVLFRGKDETSPTLSHSPVIIAPRGKEISITATATDNTQVTLVELYYKRKNETSFKKEIMALVTGTTNQYRGAIPASEVTLYDIEYYLVAYDGAGNTLKTTTYIIKGGVDKIEITRGDKNVSSITVRVGDIIYLKAKAYLGDNLVNFAGIEESEYKFVWTDKQKKGSIMSISPQEIKYFPKEKGDEVIEVVLTVAGKEIKATLNIAIDKGIEDIVSIDPESYNIGNLVAMGCTGCQRPAEPIVFPPMKITAIREDGYKDVTKKPITNNVVFYFNHRTSSAKERGIVNREVRIYDMQGRLVKKLEVRPQDGATFLNASDLPRGIYIYQGVEMDVSGAVIRSEKPKMIRILR
ncbi:MAG: hypothetical protein DDT19_02034 [Syntrophomonadaceae bacterium]|nr:hypothetical protein [Bacillota bacterium]